MYMNVVVLKLITINQSQYNVLETSKFNYFKGPSFPAKSEK